jgi:tripartite-type tricarboxylate transporter receptor subunit TctC
MAGLFVRALVAMVGLASIVHPPSASAQQAEFPTRSIILIVPFPPGGATDIVARVLAARMSDDLGQRVVVENRTGASGNIGTLSVVRAAPDGYTLVLITTTQLINQFLTQAPSYNLFTDLVPVALIADAPEVLAVSTKVKAKTLAEFAEAARASPSGFNFGSAGTGSVPHLGGELLARAMKAKMVHVPFRGTSDAMREVAAGNVELSIATQASVASFVGGGLVRILGVAAPRRLTTLPDVPTTAEGGFPGVELSNWFGIMAPRGTSPQLVSRINYVFNKALAHPDVTAMLLKQGIEPVRETPEQFAARLESDAKIYKKTLDEIGVAPQ